MHDSACCKRSLKFARKHTDAMKDSQYNNSHGTCRGQQKLVPSQFKQPFSTGLCGSESPLNGY